MKTTVNIKARLDRTINTKKGVAYIFINTRQVKEYTIKTKYCVYLNENAIIPDNNSEYIVKGQLLATEREYNGKKYPSLFVNNSELSTLKGNDYEYFVLHFSPDDDLNVTYDADSIRFFSNGVHYNLINKASFDIGAIVQEISNIDNKNIKLLIQRGWYEVVNKDVLTFTGLVTDMDIKEKGKYNTLLFNSLN